MVNGGFQMFFRTPSGIEIPAQAHHLRKVHAFDEDLREGLGLTSLYNKGLGSTATDHQLRSHRRPRRSAEAPPLGQMTIAH